MIEMKQTGPCQVTLWLDGRVSGGAEWTWGVLRWDREGAQTARLTRFEAAPGEDTDALWAYLEFLWQPLGVAAVQTPTGELRWYSKALERSWQAAGSPTDFQ